MGLFRSTSAKAERGAQALVGRTAIGVKGYYINQRWSLSGPVSLVPRLIT